MNFEYSKTKPCNQMLLNGFCLKGAKCNFAHSKIELKSIECNHGLACRHFLQGRCNYFHKYLENKNEWMDRVNISFPRKNNMDSLQCIGSKKRIKHSELLYSKSK